MQIAVLGAGSWGTTLAILLAGNSHAVTLWSHKPEHVEEIRATRENPRFLPGVTIPQSISVTNDLQQAIHGAGLIVAAVPAQFLRSVAQQIKGHDFSNVRIVNVAKGIENGSLMRMSEVLLDTLPTLDLDNISTLSGPSFAEEVARKVPTTVVAGSPNLDTARFTQSVFMTPYFRVYSSDDLLGVELGGSIKNVIAIGAGIADGAGFGDNTKAAIMTRATAELSRLGTALGAQPRTFAGLSGIGDLIVTCMSRHSRNRHVGEQIGKGRKLSAILGEMVMVAEGVASTKSVHALGTQYKVELPLVNEVYGVLFEEKDVSVATADLMTRAAKEEH